MIVVVFRSGFNYSRILLIAKVLVEEICRFSGVRRNFSGGGGGGLLGFLENFNQKIEFFFGACSPIKISHIRAKGAVRNILRLFSEKWMS